MNVNNIITEAPTKAAVPVIEQVWGEKPGGGLVANPSFEVKQGTAVYESSGKYYPIKGYRLYAAVGSEDTTIKIYKGSGIEVGDKIGHARKSVACTAVDTTNANYDLVTVTLAASIAKNVVLYEAATASASSATPKATPTYIVGNDVPSGKGDIAVRLINGANLRKETAPIAEEVVALMSNINLV